MLRHISRLFTESKLKTTLRLLNLTPKPPAASPDPVAASPSNPIKKKVKFLLQKSGAKAPISRTSALEALVNIPSTNHELPKEFESRESENNDISKILTEKSEAHQRFITGILTIPQEDVHYSVKKRVTEDDGMDSLTIRSYISSTMRSHQTEGMQFGESSIPEYALKKHDASMIKFYPGTNTGEGTKNEIDLNHWADWYINNQPEDIKSLEESDWEPLDFDKERITDAEEEIMASIDSNNKKGDEERASGSANHANEGGQNASRMGNATYYQANLAEEFMERKLDIIEDGRKLHFQEFLEKKNVGVASFHTPLEDSSLLPPGPPVTSSDIVRFNNDIESWCIFRNVPYFYRYLKDFDRVDEMYHSTEPWVPVRLPSLLNYYEMLPNYYKSHRLVQAVTVCLERFHPTMSRKDKELMLNRLCNLITPRNPQKYMFLQEYFDDPKKSDEEGMEMEEKDEKTDQVEEIEYDIDQSGMITGLKTKIKEDLGSDEDPDMSEGERKKRLKKKKKKQESGTEDEDEEEDLDKLMKEYEKGEDESDEPQQPESDDEEGEDSDEESSGNDSDQMTLEDLKKMNIKTRVFTPEEQLRQLLGETIEEEDIENLEFDIVDEKVDWFTRDHENPDGLMPSPITFYDNKDGYWDHWIAMKRERAGLPAISARPYFKH